MSLSFLHLVAYGAVILGFCFVVLSLACGLYYLAELVEEYTVYTRKVIKTMTGTVVAIHVLLWIVDRLPFLPLAFSVLCHGVYTMNLKTFPFISLTSPPFIASCVLVFVDHFLWFQYFTTHYRPFMDIAAFFGICVWLIPFTYFISLSANDNALPMTETVVDAIPSHQKKGLFRSVVSVFERKSDSLPAESMAQPPPPPPPSTTSASAAWSTTAYGPSSSSSSSSIQHRKAA